MKSTLNTQFLTLVLGLIFMLVACDKAELEPITKTSHEIDQITYQPLQLNQIMSSIETMVITGNSRPFKTTSRGKNDLVEASYVMPDGFNMARASNGETFGISGTGDLTLHPKSVCGSGNWAHYASNGDMLGSGYWEAKQLLSFVDYGPSPAFPPFAQFVHAGKSLIRIHLGQPANVDAILTIYCILPEVATPASWPEGIKINIQEGGPNFNQVLPGGTFFGFPNDPDCDPCFSPFPVCSG